MEALRREAGISDAAVNAIAAVPRELFVPARFSELVYADVALQLGEGATISAPSMVAAMISAMRPAAGLRVLEIGAGSGYAAAAMAAAGMEVVGVEISPILARQARAAIDRAGYADRVTVEIGDGMAGWPPGAPYDRVVASAAVAALPQAWLEQVVEGGLIVYPESGAEWDMLVRVERLETGWRREDVQPCRFVRMQV
ncbi:MAG TPA: protein-L-isoaspartate O-methyltransferase [Candidatus Dormibacteraeota bacterium]